jgi:hypothetical protein
VVRDLRLVESTDRFGGEIRLAVVHHFTGNASFGVAASAYGFSGPSDIVLLEPTTPDGLANFGVGGLFGPAVKAVFRWDLRATRQGPFAEIGAGRLWVSEGNTGEPWFDVLSGGLGYRRRMSARTGFFAEIEYERLSGSRPAPEWLVPMLVGMRWSFGR